MPSSFSYPSSSSSQTPRGIAAEDPGRGQMLPSPSPGSSAESLASPPAERARACWASGPNGQACGIRESLDTAGRCPLHHIPVAARANSPGMVPPTPRASASPTPPRSAVRIAPSMRGVPLVHPGAHSMRSVPLVRMGAIADALPSRRPRRELMPTLAKTQTPAAGNNTAWNNAGAARPAETEGPPRMRVVAKITGARSIPLCGAPTASGAACKSPFLTRFGFCPRHTQEIHGVRAGRGELPVGQPKAGPVAAAAALSTAAAAPSAPSAAGRRYPSVTQPASQPPGALAANAACNATAGSTVVVATRPVGVPLALQQPGVPLRPPSAPALPSAPAPAARTPPGVRSHPPRATRIPTSPLAGPRARPRKQKGPGRPPRIRLPADLPRARRIVHYPGVVARPPRLRAVDIAGRPWIISPTARGPIARARLAKAKGGTARLSVARSSPIVKPPRDPRKEAIRAALDAVGKAEATTSPTRRRPVLMPTTGVFAPDANAKSEPAATSPTRRRPVLTPASGALSSPAAGSAATPRRSSLLTSLGYVGTGTSQGTSRGTVAPKLEPVTPARRQPRIVVTGMPERQSQPAPVRQTGVQTGVHPLVAPGHTPGLSVGAPSSAAGQSPGRAMLTPRRRPPMASAAPGTRGVSDQTAARALLTPKRTVGPRAGAAESPGRTMLTPRRLPPRSAVAGAASASGTNAASLQSPARALFTLKRPPPRPVVAGASAATPTSSSQLPPRRLPPRPVVAGMPSQLPPHRLPARPTVPSRALSNPSQSPARALLTPRRVLSTTNLSEPVGRNPTLTNPNMCAAPTSTGRLCENPNLEPFGRCPPHASPKRLAPRPAAVPASEFANNNPALMNPNMCAAPTEEGVLCENPNFARFGRCPLHSSLRNAGTDEVEEGKREPTTFFEQSLLAAAGGPVSGPTAGTNNVASVENAVGNATMKNTGADRSGGHAGPTAQHSVTPPGGKRKLSDSHAVAPAAADADGDDSFRTLARAGLKRPRRTSEAGADDNGGENVELDGDVDTTPNGTVQTATGGALRRMVGRVLGFWKSEDEVANDG